MLWQKISPGYFSESRWRRNIEKGRFNTQLLLWDTCTDVLSLLLLPVYLSWRSCVPLQKYTCCIFLSLRGLKITHHFLMYACLKREMWRQWVLSIGTVCVYVALSRVVCVWSWYFGRHAVVVMDSLTVVALRKAGWMEAQHSGHRARSTSSSPCPAPSTRWVMSVLLMRPNPFLLHMTHRVQCQSCTCLHTPLGVCFSVSLFSPVSVSEFCSKLHNMQCASPLPPNWQY